MKACKYTEAPVLVKPSKLSVQTSYHSEISLEYFASLQATVDKLKPEVFHLTPISEAGW